MTCHRLGEADQQTISKKIIICSSAIKQSEKTFANMRKLANIDVQRYFFRRNNKLFINENLTTMNKNLAYHGRNLE